MGGGLKLNGETNLVQLKLSTHRCDHLSEPEAQVGYSWADGHLHKSATEAVLFWKNKSSSERLATQMSHRPS